MLQKDLRAECKARSIRVGLAKPELRRCLRLYDAARALGLTPEDSLEAQEAAFQQDDVSARESIEKDSFDATPEEVIEGHRRDNTQEFIDGQESTFRKSPEDGTSCTTSPQAFSDKDIASSSVTSQDSTQDHGFPNIFPEPAKMPSYAMMGQTELRSLCRSRSLKRNGLSGPQLPSALTAYDRKLVKQAKSAEVEVDNESSTAKLGNIPTAYPPPLALIDHDSSSQDGETAEQRPRSAVTDAATSRQESVSGYLRTISQGPRSPESSDPQLQNRQVKSVEQASAEIPREQGPYTPPRSPRLVLKPPKRFGNESNPGGRRVAKAQCHYIILMSQS